ncbi:MAG TPA: hypothetical protein VHM25_21215, partial [Polyangiaceae bacterium]|nr:hypothetical protein [Polyangiaceae bacterium]
MIEPPRSTSLLVSLVALFAACGAPPAAAPQAPPADAEAKLKTALEARDEATKQLAAAPKDIVADCRMRGGDCLISLAERRDTLISKHYLNPCRELQAEPQNTCIEQELEKKGERAELASFYETESWCTRKLLECISAFTSNAEQMATRQRAQDRRAEIEGAPESLVAQRAPEFAKEKRDFVRSIVPPKGQAECQPMAPEACEKTLEAPNAEFSAELNKAPAAYDAKRALAQYAAIQRAEGECHAPEVRCLQTQLQQYGGTPETDKLLQQNLTLITQQQA